MTRTVLETVAQAVDRIHSDISALQQYRKIRGTPGSRDCCGGTKNACFHFVFPFIMLSSRLCPACGTLAHTPDKTQKQRAIISHFSTGVGRQRGVEGGVAPLSLRAVSSAFVSHTGGKEGAVNIRHARCPNRRGRRHEKETAAYISPSAP